MIHYICQNHCLRKDSINEKTSWSKHILLNYAKISHSCEYLRLIIICLWLRTVCYLVLYKNWFCCGSVWQEISQTRLLLSILCSRWQRSHRNLSVLVSLEAISIWQKLDKTESRLFLFWLLVSVQLLAIFYILVTG
jgi:hypothetical protein